MSADPHFLVVGDGDDLPTIRQLLGRLPVGAYGQVYVEVAAPVQLQELPAPAGMSVSWLARSRATGRPADVPRGGLAARAIVAWVAEWMPELPANPTVLWIGCGASPEVERLTARLGERIRGLHLHRPAP